MKIDVLSRKLHRLEKKMDVPGFHRDSTRIAWECLTRAERTLFTKIHEIVEEYGENPPSDIMQENLALFKKGFEIMLTRSFDLFRASINALVLHDDKVDEFIFWTRFMRFFHEIMWIITRNKLEEQKLSDLFGDDVWPSDDDPRWSDYDRWMERLEREKEEEWEREDRKMDESLKHSLETSMKKQ